MEQSKGEQTLLSEVQKAIPQRSGNVTFFKKVGLEKGGSKYLVISTNRVFILSTKTPFKAETSFHLLEIKSVESSKPCMLQFKVVHEKPVSVAIATESDDDIQFIVAQIIALLRHNFPGSSRGNELKLKIEPSEKLENITKIAVALASPASDTDMGPCGGFSLSYSSICDLHGAKPMAEVIWDVDKIYGSHGCKNFNISDFDHLEVKELIPILETFEYNNWFQGLSCRSYKLSNELVDVLAKVFRSNTSIEELDLYECRLSKENVQKLSQAVTSNPKTGLKRINLGKNTIDDRGASSFFAVLSALQHGLESLLIKDVGITAKGVSSIFSAVKGNHHMASSLTCLNLSSNPLKADGTSAVCEFFAKANVLQELHLSNSECSLELVFGALARGCLQHLKIVNLAGNPPSYRKSKDTQIAPSVTTFFSSSMALESANLSRTKISAEFIKAILIGLISNTGLKDVSLNLSGNELRSAGAAEISSCIDSVKNLVQLELDDNGLDMDLIAICQSVKKSTSLKRLSLSQNIGKSKNINVPEILESIVEMIIMESLPLTSLSIADNRLRQDAYVIIDALGTNGLLEELDISGNIIGDEGARLLAKALQINTKLKKISLDRNGITLKGYSSIAMSIERNYTLQLIPTPFGDLLPLTKSNGQAVTKCFTKIDELLLRNQSIEVAEKDPSVKLKQNLLLNSLDQESTDYLLVKVQDAIAELSGLENDETIAKEVEAGKEAIKDADQMKQMLFKLFVDLGNPSKKIEEKADEMLKEVTGFANDLVKENVSGTLTHVKEQCSSIASNEDTLKELEALVSSEGKVDSLGLRETITRTMVGLISNKVNDATLRVASALGESLTNMMQETLNQSKVKLDLLSMENKDKELNKDAQKTGSLPRSPVDDKDESLLAAQKAKNRMSTQLFADDGTVRSKGIARRPTFRREKHFEDVAVEISIDDVPVVENNEKVKKEAELERNTEAKEEESIQPPKEKKSQSEEAYEGEKEAKQQKEDDKKSWKAEDHTEAKKKEELATDTCKLEALAKLHKPKLEQSNPRAGSLSLKPNKMSPEVGKKPRPMSDLSFLEIDRAKSKELVHLNKGRAKPKGRRPPSKAAGLAHLTANEEEIDVDETPKEENKKETTPNSKKEEKGLRTPPKPRPKSMQPLDSPSTEKEMGVIRTGSIPHKSSEALKAKLKLEEEAPKVDLTSKPDIKSPPKPEPPKKEDSVKKKPKLPKGVPLPGFPNILGKPSLSKKDRSPSLKKDEQTEGSHNSEDETSMKTEDSQVDTLKLDDNVGNESSPQAEAEKEKTPEVAEKPKSKKFKPPGGVPLMGGPMGFGGALMAEMKKKRGIKDKEPETPDKHNTEEKPATENKPPAVTSPPTAAKPTPVARKPPPPARLSAEKRRSLILEAGAKPVITDKPDGSVIEEKKEADAAEEKATATEGEGGSAEKHGDGISEEAENQGSKEATEEIVKEKNISEQNNNIEMGENQI